MLKKQRMNVLNFDSKWNQNPRRCHHKYISIMIPSYKFQNMIGSTTSHSLNMKATIVITTLLIFTLVYCIVQHICWSWWCFRPTIRSQPQSHRSHQHETPSFQSSSTNVSSGELNELPSTQQVV